MRVHRTGEHRYIHINVDAYRIIYIYRDPCALDPLPARSVCGVQVAEKSSVRRRLQGHWPRLSRERYSK